MITCPKCGITLEEKTAVCECGSILFGEVTNVSRWETETIVHVSDTRRKRIVPAVAVAFAVALAVLALSWPRLSESLVADSGTPASVEESVAQNPSRSDLIPTDDLIRPDLDVNADNRSGAFEFTAEITHARSVRKPKPNPDAQTQEALLIADPKGAQTNSLDVELLSDPSNIQTRGAADPADCKPEMTTSLKRPEARTDVAEINTEKKTSPTGYTLGPRGGCFMVTSTGGKKYVDRGLCNSSTAGARQ